MDISKLNGVNELTVVHCPTKEEAIKVLNIADKAGLTWMNGRKFLEDWTDKEGKIVSGLKWDIRGSVSTYHFYEGILHSIRNLDAEKYKIISAETFLELNE